MLIHHDNREYNVAASDAAKHARTIMEKKIQEGVASATRLFERIHTEVPSDVISKSGALKFGYDEQNPGLRMLTSAQDKLLIREYQTVHTHALGQLAGKAGVPGAFMAELVNGEEWQRALAANIFNEYFHKEAQLTKNRYLVRSVEGQVRGFLSDRYRRLDSRPLLEAFAAACQTIGAVPVDGTFSDTRVTLKAFLPMVFEPVPNEVMCLGIEWGNSDFGAARHTVRAMIWRLWCTNKATMEDSLAQVHLGGRLADDIEFSKRTYELDTKTSVSALNDVVKNVLGPGKVNLLLETIKQANANQVEWKNVKTAVQRRLLKSEMQAVETAFMSEDVVNLPPGKTVWRASNALSWIAGQCKDPDRKLELERYAGEILNGKRDAQAQEDAA